MIPKTIHYCWFGDNPKSKLNEKCIDSWKKICPDYQIVEWNETNVDIESCPIYVQEAYENRKWAFVSDYIRLKVVYENGGIYLDTDVELLKRPDELLGYDAYFGIDEEKRVATGLGFGACSKHPLIKYLMDDYINAVFVNPDDTFDLTPCPNRNTAAIYSYFGVTNLDGLNNNKENIKFLPNEYLNPYNNSTDIMNITNNTVSIHWYSASWFTEDHWIYHRYVVRKAKWQRLLGNKCGEIAVKITYRLLFRNDRERLKKM